MTFSQRSNDLETTAGSHDHKPLSRRERRHDPSPQLEHGVGADVSGAELDCELLPVGQHVEQADCARHRRRHRGARLRARGSLTGPTRPRCTHTARSACTC
jgi:hypothetical protein